MKFVRLLMSVGRLVLLVAPRKLTSLPALVTAPPTQMSTFRPAVCAKETKSAELAAVTPLPVAFSEPSGLTVTREWMTCVTTVKSILEAGMPDCSQPG